VGSVHMGGMGITRTWVTGVDLGGATGLLIGDRQSRPGKEKGAFNLLGLRAGHDHKREYVAAASFSVCLIGPKGSSG